MPTETTCSSDFERMEEAYLLEKKYQRLYIDISSLVEPPRPSSQGILTLDDIREATLIDRGHGDYYDIFVISHWCQSNDFEDLGSHKQDLYWLLLHGPNVSALLETAINESTISLYIEKATELVATKLNPQQVSDRLREFRPWLDRAVLSKSSVQGQWLLRRQVATESSP